MAVRCGSCKDRHESASEVRSCYAMADEAKAEIHAEAVMTWVAGGGSYADAQRYASVIASGKTWDEHLREQDAEMAKQIEAAGTCEHGLSAALCEGPQHYPADDPYDW